MTVTVKIRNDNRTFRYEATRIKYLNNEYTKLVKITEVGGEMHNFEADKIEDLIVE